MHTHTQIATPIDSDTLRAKDEGDLNVLSVLHYVWSALMSCSSVAILGYFVFIALVFVGAKPPPGHPAGHTDAVAGVTLIVGIATFAIFVPFLVMHFLAAHGLKTKRRYTLVLVTAALACLSFPLGTGLGVWTFIVMMRPSVKALFATA